MQNFITQKKKWVYNSLLCNRCMCIKKEQFNNENENKKEGQNKSRHQLQFSVTDI